MKTYFNQIMFVFNFVCFTALSANNINTPSNGNVATTIRPIGSRKCFKCTSWTTTYCTQRTSLSVAMQYFPLVWCPGSCITRAIEHDGVTDVIRGCSTGGSDVKQTTCDDDYCNLNHGNPVRSSTVYTTFIMTILCSLLFID
ncbi:uncharacterized protein [Mytilus edulis]|uniref:uncharacterized protein n=1 Tax=Mytilus edulis TaxID=6550 RepID=UPI0039F0AF7F